MPRSGASSTAPSPGRDATSTSSPTDRTLRPSPPELKDGGYHIAHFGQPPAPDAPCPRCVEGKLQPRKRPGTHETFYGCSNYPYCDYSQPACPSCNTGLPTRSDRGMHCPTCGHEVEPCPTLPRLAAGAHRPPRAFPRLRRLSHLPAQPASARGSAAIVAGRPRCPAPLPTRPPQPSLSTDTDTHDEPSVSKAITAPSIRPSTAFPSPSRTGSTSAR